VLALDAAPAFGSASPRLAPPLPAHSDLAGFEETATALGISLYPWQRVGARYAEALTPEDTHLFREVVWVVARQNGKTTLLKPLIIRRLKAGRRLMHTAQNRELPREMFGEVADALMAEDDERLSNGEASLFQMRHGRPILPRFGAGQEEIRMANGGRYRIVAPTKSGARGPSNDDVIVDEVRELDDWLFIAAARPTLAASADPQFIYLSNAGDDSSVVLNALRERRNDDPRLAYVEWSADPERDIADREGWYEANPSIGHNPGHLAYLEDEYRVSVLDRTLPIFQTEHLCRWVASMRERFVAAEKWDSLKGELGAMVRPVIGINLDPMRERASVVIAWQRPDTKVAMRLLFDVTGHPIDTDRLGKDIVTKARELGVRRVAFDGLTDVALADQFKVIRKVPIVGQKFANACSSFAERIEGATLVWADSAAVGDDLAFTSRKPHEESGTFVAVRADDDRPITASLAAIRAVWLASAPQPTSDPNRQSSVMGF
jgi:hypothetical protein